MNFTFTAGKRTAGTLISLKLTIHHEISSPAGSGLESRGTTWRTKPSSPGKLRPAPARSVTVTMKVLSIRTRDC